jgi:hypothetical protein
LTAQFSVAEASSVHVCSLVQPTMGSAIYGQQGELGQLFSKETQAIFFNWKVGGTGTRRSWASHLG